MTTQTLTLTDFLLARIAEDVAHWAAAAEWAPYCQECAALSDVEPGPTVTQMLTECEAKRRIVEECAEMLGYTEKSSAPILAGLVLAHLAIPYAEHPDHREEWRA